MGEHSLCFFGNMSILNSNLYDNHMLPGSLGGAILGLNGSFFVLNSNFSQIIAQLGGAMTLQRGSVVRIENCFSLQMQHLKQVVSFTYQMGAFLHYKTTSLVQMIMLFPTSLNTTPPIPSIC